MGGENSLIDNEYESWNNLFEDWEEPLKQLIWWLKKDVLFERRHTFWSRYLWFKTCLRKEIYSQEKHSESEQKPIFWGKHASKKKQILKVGEIDIWKRKVPHSNEG